MIQSEYLAWFIENSILLLFMIALAFFLGLIASYIEGVAYRLCTLNPLVPQNTREHYILRTYQESRRKLDILLLSLYTGSFSLFLIAGILLDNPIGLACCLFLGLAMISDLRNGIYLENRVAKRIKEQEALLSGSTQLFG